MIDTHVLLWWLTDMGKLSTLAREFMDVCMTSDRRFILSGVSLWELELKRRKGKLRLPDRVTLWLPRLRKLDFVELLGTSPELWLRTAKLDWLHSDPADRIIAATALSRGVPVLTKDRVFHAEDSPVEAVW